jgi:hypothetical protein
VWVYVLFAVTQAIRIADLMSVILTKDIRRLFIVLNCD